MIARTTTTPNPMANPLALFVAGPLLQLALAWFAWYFYGLAHTQLQPEQQLAWQRFAIALALLIITWSSISVRLWLTKRKASWRSAVGLSVCSSGALYGLVFYATSLIPQNLPPWAISSDDLIWAPFCALMPGILYGVLLLALQLTPPTQRRAWTSFAVMLAIPLFCYLTFTEAVPLLRRLPDGPFWRHSYVVFCISLLATFIFFSLRWVLILARRSPPWITAGLRFLCCLCFPVLGLWVNNSLDHGFSFGFRQSGGIFGDFSDPLFLAMALLNGLVLTIPASPKIPYATSCLLFARCFCVPVSLYFFIVFVPFVPLALPGIVVYGSGLLLLTPSLVAFFHARAIHGDLLTLYTNRSWRTLSAAFACMLIIPLAIYISFLSDRHTLQLALSSMLDPDYHSLSRPAINRGRLSRVLATISHDKQKMRMPLVKGTPLLSSLYRSVVLDNLTLADTTLAAIAQSYEISLTQPLAPLLSDPEAQATLAEVTSTTSYSQDIGAYKSILNITTATDLTGAQEFSVDFELPPGAWVSAYQLRVGEQDVAGQIIERKAAQWVFNQIRGERRDPGLLSYLSPSKLRLRVFPVTKDEPRRTSITIIHPAPFLLVLPTATLRLDDVRATVPVPEIQRSGAGIYIPASIKAALPTVTRAPYLYFIIDCQVTTSSFTIQRMQELIKQSGSPAASHEFIAGRRSFEAVSATDAFASSPYHCRHDGAFDVDFALKALSVASASFAQTSYPIPVIVTDDISRARMPRELQAFKTLIPELRAAVLLESQTVSVRSIDDLRVILPYKPLDLFQPVPVHAFPSAEAALAYLPADNNAALIYDPKNSTPPSSSGQSLWLKGLRLYGDWLGSVYSPAYRTDATWRQIIRTSIETGILSPVTSYLVVETELQREALRRLQQQRLSGRKHMDVGEMRRMDEPSLAWIVAILLGLALITRQWKLLNRPAHSRGRK